MHTAPLRALAGCAAITIAVMTQAPSQASAAPTPSGNQGLAKGRLVHTDGSPAAGAVVTVYALPSETPGNMMKVGERRTFEVLGQFRADKQGRYAAAVKRSSLARFRDEGGNVNAEVVARDTRGNIASMTVGLAPIDAQESVAAARAASKADAPLTPVQVADLTLASPEVAAAKNSTPGKKVSDTARTTGDPATQAGDPGSAQAKQWVAPISATDTFVDGAGASDVVETEMGACGTTLVSDLGQRSVWVGGTYVTTTGVTADLIYNASSSSTLGVGVSTGGSYGSFSASGSVSKSSSGTVNFAAHSSRQHAYTYFVYGKFGYWCDSRPGYYEYKVMARSWAGGSSVYTPSSAPTASYCTPNSAGSSFAKTTSTAYTFGTGADVSGAIGIDLSSRTGYSTQTQATFKFTYARKLCGTNALPGGSPGRLVAKT